MVDHRPGLRRAALVTFTVLAATSACTSDTPAEQPASNSPVATQSDAAAPTTIPASAFYEVPTNIRSSDRTQAEGSEAVPKLCDGELAAGAGAVASAAMRTTYRRPQDPAESVPHGVLFQTIRSYEGDSAAAFMDRLEDGLADCQSYRDGDATVKLKTVVKDDALTIDLVRPQTDLPGNPVDGEQTNRIVVMRFGPVVTILYDSEYERTSSEPAIVDTFVSGATEAIKDWRG